MSTRPDIIIVTETWDGLGLAMLAERQGSNVLVAYDISRLKDEKDHDAAEQCGEGLVERMELAKALKMYAGTGALWLFDNNAFPAQADKLRKAGDQVLGTGALSAKMEKDRDYAAELAKDVGFALSDTEEFSDTDAAITYLEQHPDTAYVCKAQGGDADQTFVPLPGDPERVANEELRGYLTALAAVDEKDRAKRFILQERISGGIEVNVDLWVHRGRPLGAFVDLEAKRRLNGDLGELIGCAGDLLFQVPVTSRLVRETAGRFLGREEFADYTGSIDANVILAGKKQYWLEACDRLGYNAAPTLFYGLARSHLEPILSAWATGKPVAPLFSRGYAASLTLLASEHQPGFPVLVPSHVAEHFCPYALRAGDGGGLVMVGGGKAWYAVGCVVVGAAAARAAWLRCGEYAAEIAFPNKGHRTDLSETEPMTLPLARSQALQRAGLTGKSALATQRAAS